MLRKTAFFLIFIFIIQLFSVFSVGATERFNDLAAEAAILVERDNGTVLFEQNARTPHPADDLAKVMTLLLAAQAVESNEDGFRRFNDHELITMTHNAWDGLSESAISNELQPEDVLPFIDLIYYAYVGNAAEACNMIALHIAGSVEAFVDMMNAKASEFGARSTRFVNTHGQFNENQVTTAYDQYRIFDEAMKSALFSEVAGTFRHITESTEQSEPRTLTSSNFLLNPSSRLYYRHGISGRESATYEGGHSLVSYAEEDGLSLISVILGARVTVHTDGTTELHNFTETLRLFQWGYMNFSWRDILRTTDLLARVPIRHGSGADFVNARPEAALTLLLENSIPNEAFDREITLIYDEEENPLIAPVTAGEIVGEVTVSRNGVVIGAVPLVANTNISLNGFEYMRRQVSALLSTTIARNIMIVLILLVALYVLLVIRYNIVRANRLRRIKNAKNEIIRDRHQNFRD